MNMVNPDAKDKDAVAPIQYIADEDKPNSSLRISRLYKRR